MKKYNLRGLFICLATVSIMISGCASSEDSAGNRTEMGTVANTSASNESQQVEEITVGSNDTSASSEDSTDVKYNSIEELGLEEPVRPEAAKQIKEEKIKLGTNHEAPKNSTLPRIDIVLPADYTLSKYEYTHGTIALSNTNGFDLNAAPGKVRIRGNSTAEAAKRPLKIRFDEKQGLLGHEPEKTWTLLANAFDKTGIHNFVSLDLYKYLSPNGTFVPMCEFVDLYVNGAYQGVYNLCDQIETGKGRVDINGQIGTTPDLCDYLVVDNFRANGDTDIKEGLDWFWMKWTNDAIEIKSPETKDGLTEEHTNYIKSYLDETYEFIKLKNWEEIQKRIDVESFVIGLYLSEITNNTDIAQASMYMYKKAEGKLTYGPAWDYDLTFGSCMSKTEGAVDYMGTQNNVFFGELMNVPEFYDMYVTYLEEHLPDTQEHILNKIDDTEKQYGLILESDYQIWGDKWNINIPEMDNFLTHAEQTEFMKQWTKDRITFLKDYYQIGD